LKVDAVLLGLLTGGADNSEVGVYGAAFRLVEATMFLTWSFGAAMLPWFARVAETRSEVTARAYERGLKVMTAVLLPIGLVFVLLADPLIGVIYGEPFDGAVLPLQLLGVMVILYGVNDLAATVLIALDRPSDFTRIVGVVAAENIIMNLILIPPYGADGAAFNAALSAALLAIASVPKVSSVVGPIRLGRAFAGPLAGGAVLAATVLTTELPLGPALLLGGGAYLVVLALFERIAFPEDVRVFMQLMRRPRPLPGGSLADTERITELRAEG
jgi:O-antigen/teichoic acid export membrane protein